ncbi:NAD(P)H-dependent glycerol-3-phosphate dehydrogenase [Calothrix sp. UHCC 0171]|uniref:NAD(P)H-dependent glycerol-3-phosphate dehydrogenase n=1 Tax=Calothrix sp. UHCC 0171 TaxID=3110245 RepID=UPI002B2077FB|nr:NAD(P)H-dependent glycerol-3-phosphate dehydrogenase [Calothrix sp. UHCC 0171]MEA5571860.1 NAD(P)H-dependent glycerol-3-phosphate dehydrogenase [Calothrix sp. UHCC 0171]
MTNPKNITVLGAGAWGTALAVIAKNKNHQVKIWSRSGLTSGDALSLTDVVKDADIILSAISMKGVSEVAKQIQSLSIPKDVIFVTATKGLDPETTRTPSQIWQAMFPLHPVVVLSGPNLSKEIQQGLPSATVVASRSATAAEFVQIIFSSPQFRVYTNLDPLGVELGGTLKNVIAIASGVCDGLNLGTNAKAALVTRGLTEMVRIAVSWGAKAETFYGLSGLGDLLATCNSSLSRNYQVGYQLAQGKTLSEVIADLQGTAEGVNTCKVLMQSAKKQNISMPITEQVYRLLQAEITPRQALEELMLRDIKPEYHD